MLSFVICAAEATSDLLLTHIRHCCKEIGKRWRLVITTQDADEALEFLLAEHASCIVIMEVEAQSEAVRGRLRLIKGLQQAAQEHVMALVLDHLQMLELLVNCNAQPNGVLMKPLQGETVNKVLLRLLRESLKLHGSGTSNVVLQEGRNLQMVSLKSIVYLEAREKRVDVHTTVQRISVYKSLQSIEQQLNECFCRCHRAFIVNEEHILQADFTGMNLVLTGNVRIPIARSARDTVRRRIFERGQQVNV